MLKRISLVLAMAAAMALVAVGCITPKGAADKCCGTCKNAEVQKSCCGTCKASAKKACAAGCKKPCCAKKAACCGKGGSCCKK